MSLNLVHGQIQKANKNGFHNRPFHINDYALAKLNPYRTHKSRQINGNKQ